MGCEIFKQRLAKDFPTTYEYEATLLEDIKDPKVERVKLETN